MKLIHCSDIHLDSRMESNLTREQARERSAELCATFGRLIRYAKENQVAAVLIAGDLFDCGRASARTADFVLDQIRRAPEVTVYYLRGNHDEGALLQNRELPENLRTFSDRWTTWDQADISITGREPEGESWGRMYAELELDPNRTNIVMLHGMESSQPGQELVALPLLRGKHIDYLALGHIHSHKVEKLDADGIWAYCGCLEGRGFDECGEKGFVLLDVEGKRIKTEFVPFASRQMVEIPVDITGLTTVTQLHNGLETASKDIDSKSLVKFTLTGTFTPETQKDLPFLKKLLEPGFYAVRIKDESRLSMDPESYIHDMSLKGEFIRLVMASDRSPEEKETIICLGLRALAGEEVEL